MKTLSANDKKFYIIVAVSLLIMFGFGALPPFGQISTQGMRVLGIFLGCIFAWCFGELVWSSLIGFVLLTVYGFGSMSGNFATAYGSNIIAIMISATVFCYAIQKNGLLAEIAKWIIGQRWAQKSVWSLVFAFYITAVVLGALATNAAPAIILLWSLFYEMAKQIGIKPYEPLAVIILCGIGVLAYVGVAIMPYGGMTVIVRAAAEGFEPGFVFNIGQYMFLNLLVAVVFTPLIVVVLRFFAGKKVNLVMPKNDPYKMNLTVEMKISLVLLAAAIICMVVPNFLAADNPFKVLFGDKLTIVGIFIIAATILTLIRIDGKPIFDIAEGVSNVPWNLIIMIASAVTISNLMTADGMGVVPTIVDLFAPLVEGKSAFAITLFFVACGLIMTNFLNDVVTCIVLYPIAAQFILDAGGSTMLFAILFAQVTIQGCLMPSGSFVGAMFHGNGEWMKPKDVIKWVAIMEIVLLIVLLGAAIVGGILGY